ncbi:MAG: DNA (cytosine-5-)-methyltransferase, partial [Fibrobacter sp.]|nr:DNA (cytosine-5-)-methyltransferase [Fibrobacter sp.]
MAVSVLIGTYRGKNLDWIQRENYYNLPIVGAPRDDGFSDISHVILIAKEHPVIAYEATATEVVDQKWLKSKKYSVLLKKPHGEKYQLFKLGKACSWQELLLDATKDIYVWTASFSGKITADFYRKTLPKLGDWSAAYILNKIKPYIKGRKNVFAVATQDDFFELLKTKRQENVPFPSPKNPKFTFIDLFAGIGGFRLAMQQNGGECVFSSEWNEAAQKTYEANYGEVPFGDITSEATKRKIPEGFDILCAGFPCQPFSIAGVSKKKSLGRATGFEDKTQGTLFFDVCTILKRRRPKAFLLENVKNLCSHDKGNTFRVIRESLDELDYEIFYQVIDGQNFVPQHRERILIVGFD